MRIAHRRLVGMALAANLVACTAQPPATGPTQAGKNAPAPSDAAVAVATAEPRTKRAAPAASKDALRLVCHGGNVMLLNPAASSGPSVRRPYSLIFQVKLTDITHADGEGLPPGYCGFIGRAWEPGDPPQVNFTVHGSAPSPETWMLSPDSYWTVAVAKAWGYFDAKEPVQRLGEPTPGGQ